MVRHIVGRERGTVRPFENVVTFVILPAELTAVDGFLGLGVLEDIIRLVSQRETAVAALGLGGVLLYRCQHLADGVTNRETTVVKADAVPFQAQDFTAAQTVESCDSDKRRQRVIPYDFKKGLEPLSAVETGLAAFTAGQLYRFAGVTAEESVLYGLGE